MCPSPRLILITDPRYSLAWMTEIVCAVARALEPSALAVQLRDKANAEPDVIEAAKVLRAVTREERAMFLINGRIDLARAVESDGVHVPSGLSIADAREALGRGAFVTAAAHDDDDVARACEQGADGVLVSPIFATPGKGAPRGTSALTRAAQIASCSTTRVHVYALGGVDARRVASCAEAGASGVAVIRTLFDAESAQVAARLARALTAPFAL
ncbi:MAG: thiamine phosphate synthase [Polyangiaceae bacterium]|nr:thiamine phosphate synthase [Polyangiaceae bacterium]